MVPCDIAKRYFVVSILSCRGTVTTVNLLIVDICSQIIGGNGCAQLGRPFLPHCILPRLLCERSKVIKEHCVALHRLLAMIVPKVPNDSVGGKGAWLVVARTRLGLL